MTLRYINPANDSPFVGGISTVTVPVPSGQYWIPRLIKVGMLNLPGELSIRPFEPRLMTKLYHGSPGDAGPGAFVDSTVNTPAGDVTAILNGTILQPGEWITVITSSLNLDTWTQGLVYLEVDGLTTGDANEAAQTTISSVPGLPFQGRLYYPLTMPPMADRSNTYNFSNPGLNNTVNLIGSPTNTNLFIYQVSIIALNNAGGAATNTSSELQPIPPTSPPGVITDPFMYYEPGTSNSAINFAQDFRGMQMLPGGLQYRQLGSAAPNTGTIGMQVTYRFMNV